MKILHDQMNKQQCASSHLPATAGTRTARLKRPREEEEGPDGGLTPAAATAGGTAETLVAFAPRLWPPLPLAPPPAAFPFLLAEELLPTPDPGDSGNGGEKGELKSMPVAPPLLPCHPPLPQLSTLLPPLSCVGGTT